MCCARTAALPGGDEKQIVHVSRFFGSTYSTMSKNVPRPGSRPMLQDTVDTLKQTCFQGYPESAGCVQGSIDSRNSAIHSAYRISLRPSSLFEPRHPSLKVVKVRLLETRLLERFGRVVNPARADQRAAAERESHQGPAGPRAPDPPQR